MTPAAAVPGSLEAAVAGALALLAIHAVRAHGFVYACIWLVLPACFAGALLAPGLPGAGFAIDVSPARAPRIAGVVSLLPALAACWVFLGAHFAKGLVESGPHRGRIAPFVLVHGTCAAVLALPVEAAAAALGWWRIEGSAEPAGAAAAVVAIGAAAAVFGAAYRGASRVTTWDPGKAALVAAGLAAAVAAVRGGLGAVVG